MKLLIKERIKESGMKKVFIADKLDVSRETLDNWIKGKTDIPLSKAVELAKLLRCDISDLWKE